MTWMLETVAILLLLTLVLGLVRIWRGPTIADRMLAAQLFGTTGVGLLLVLAELQDDPALRDVALVLALLAVMAVLAFVARVWRRDSEHDQDPEDPR
ncbi:multiple resistance and pH regulation protein F [Thioalkalivibrio nitratireducens DSM 14787]|uniref:Multiple resistance and pH regulation protein F n=1 Tax=Thioalkalivibrio nitratireducens (strain DSM 14787 / UNIQEM 213 / ALEN2) TaxID=1255043 RepID=L0DTW8_THIND|nr:monovalent cation/H+ antiporter complex subunit F [Thioalkalivibrio nitratireducens]AGA31811.1 multiple resistance and pH regulation protein F [Thioalkalivibrio nitratireducens DSM 14787]